MFFQRNKEVFRLGKLKIDIASATMFGRVNLQKRRIEWCIDINMKEGKIPCAGELKSVEPRLYCDDLDFEDISSWKDFEGKSLKYGKNGKAVFDEGDLVVLSDEYVNSGDMKFGNLQDNKYNFSWSGEADVNADEKHYGKNVAFSFKGQVEYLGLYITTEVADKEELVANLDGIVDLNEYDVKDYQDGKWNLVPKE